MVGEASALNLIAAIDVAQVNQHLTAYNASQSTKVECAISVPFGDDDNCIGPVRRSIGVVDHGNTGQHRRSGLHPFRVGRNHSRTSIDQALNDS